MKNHETPEDRKFIAFYLSITTGKRLRNFLMGYTGDFSIKRRRIQFESNSNSASFQLKNTALGLTGSIFGSI